MMLFSESWLQQVQSIQTMYIGTFTYAANVKCTANKLRQLLVILMAFSQINGPNLLK